MALKWLVRQRADRRSVCSICRRKRAPSGQEQRKSSLEARLIEHFTELFNQPGNLGDGIDGCLPAQRAINVKIKTGPFDMTELYTAVQHINNDKAAGSRETVHGNGAGNVQ